MSSQLPTSLRWSASPAMTSNDLAAKITYLLLISSMIAVSVGFQSLNFDVQHLLKNKKCDSSRGRRSSVMLASNFKT